MKYKRPTHKNVSEGDLLVVTTQRTQERAYSIRPIIEVYETTIKVGYPGRGCFSIHGFHDSLVLKRDGTYLVGASIDIKTEMPRRKAR